MEVVGVRSELEWGRYDAWGDAISEELFGGRWGSRPVYLDLEEEPLARIAASIGVPAARNPADELITAVGSTIDLDRSGPLFAAHAARLDAWRSGDCSMQPPVVALLAFFSLVAERMRAEGDLAASNYYGRFVSMLGSDPLDEDVKHRVFRGFAESSGDFWGALNAGLEERPDVRGLPTAFAFDHRTYVGPALSQALVRDSDRRALLRLLAVAGLRPGQTVAADDMARLLEERLPDAPLSAGLKRLAASPEVLGRIAEVACVELAAWSGGAEEADAGAGGRVALQASVRRLPRRSLRLGVAVAAPPQVTSLAPGPDCDEAGRSALAAAGGTVGLQSPDPDGWRALSGPLGIADLLASRLELVAEHGFRAHRRPLPVVALAREGASDVYREVDRVSLTAQHMLLAVQSSRERLDRELESVARAGYRVHESLPRPAAGLAALRGRRDRRHQRHLGAGPGGARPAGLGRDIARPGNEVARQVDLARTRRAGAEGHGPAGTDDRGAALGAGRADPRTRQLRGRADCRPRRARARRRRLPGRAARAGRRSGPRHGGDEAALGGRRGARPLRPRPARTRGGRALAAERRIRRLGDR